MNTSYQPLIAAVLILSVSYAVHAGSLRCAGEVISPGDTKQQLLDACGSPAARQGADWLYEPPGSLPVVVTVNGG